MVSGLFGSEVDEPEPIPSRLLSRGDFLLRHLGGRPLVEGRWNRSRCLGWYLFNCFWHLVASPARYYVVFARSRIIPNLKSQISNLKLEIILAQPDPDPCCRSYRTEADTSTAK